MDPSSQLLQCSVWACQACWKTATTQRACQLLSVAMVTQYVGTQASQDSAGKSKQSQLVGHGTMGGARCVWCAHQGTEAQLAQLMRRRAQRRPLKAQAAGGRVGPERQATSGYVRRETLAHRRSRRMGIAGGVKAFVQIALVRCDHLLIGIGDVRACWLGGVLRGSGTLGESITCFPMLDSSHHCSTGR